MYARGKTDKGNSIYQTERFQQGWWYWTSCQRFYGFEFSAPAKYYSTAVCGNDLLVFFQTNQSKTSLQVESYALYCIARCEMKTIGNFDWALRSTGRVDSFERETTSVKVPSLRELRPPKLKNCRDSCRA